MTDDPTDGTAIAKSTKRVTSADVARVSGVSRATVSYVLNDVSGRTISDSTRNLVLRTAQELGHVPFAPGRALRLGRSDIVLALVNDFELGYISNRVLRRLDEALAERGYLVLVHRFDESLRPTADLWGLISPTMVVAMGGFSLQREAVIQNTTTKFMGVYGTLPHTKAGELQVQYLYDQGHRALGYAFPSAPSLGLVATERFKGVRLACDRLGIPQPMVCSVDTDDPRTVLAALDTWTKLPEVTAIAAHNDEIAILLCAGLTARGLRVRKDLAIIGLDNIPSARINLTTIEIDINAWGRAVVNSVIAMLDNKVPDPIEGDFLHLIVRDTA